MSTDHELHIRKRVDQIFALFAKHGHLSYGEHVSQTSHAVQSACLAARDGYDDEIILTALFHDIGHLLSGDQAMLAADGQLLGNRDHEYLGASFLKSCGFSKKTEAMIKNHVAAKRYLCYKDPAYLATLSEASRQTLLQQGGPMQAKEAETFEADPYFSLSIKLRYWDDEAKIPHFDHGDLSAYKTKTLQWLLANHTQNEFQE